MRAFIAATLILLAPLSLQAADFPLVRDGQAQASIQLREDATDVEHLAAQEFARYVRHISEAKLPVNGDAGRPILLLISDRAGQGYALDVTPQRMRLSAGSPVALLHGVYDVLRKDLGCRWYAGGEIGEVIPSAETLSIDSGTRTVRPDWRIRAIIPPEESRCWWALRQGLNGWYPQDFVASLGSGTDGLLTEAEAGHLQAWYAVDRSAAGESIRYADMQWERMIAGAPLAAQQRSRWRGQTETTGACVLLDPIPGVSLPPIDPRDLAQQVRALHGAGARACTARTTGWQWARTGPAMWIIARLLWDTDAPVDELIDDWYRGFYGAAGSQMRAFAGAARKINSPAGEGLDIDAGSAAEEHLAAARAAASRSTAGERVRIRRLAFRHAVDRLRVADQTAVTSAWAEYRHSGSQEALQDAIAAARRLAERPGEMGRRFAEKAAMMEAFAAETVGIPPQTWRFRLDEEDVGMEREWFAPGFDDSEWNMIEIGRAWEEQGYADYDGYAWYRVRMRFEENWPRALSLKFLGVDGECWVYLNGEFIGHHRGWDEPFALAVPADVVKTGEQNLIAVRVWDGGGNGGIYAPVSIGGMTGGD